jgi:hypothetical protein
MKKLVLVFLVAVSWSGEAVAQFYFGRNKVHYDNFKWQILKTTHFDIYFYPEMHELAEIGATYAENAYTRLEKLTNFNINRRIPLIFYSNHFHFQQTNTTPYLVPDGVGGFFEFLKGRVVIPSDGSLAKFEHVINHELVHVFTIGLANRVLRDHKRTNYAGPPLWFTEGLAEYWSEGWSTEAEMFIRDAVLTGYLVPVSDMYRIYGSFLMYKEGQAICKFIADNFGEEKLLLLIENLWKADSFSEVMALTLGTNYRKFDELWLYHLKKKKYPLMEDHDAPGMITKHITDKGISTKPTYAAYENDRHLIFASNRVGYSNIYRLPYEHGEGEKRELETIIEGERTSEFEAFNLLHGKMDADQRGNLAFVSKSKGRDALYIYSLPKRRVLSRHQFKNMVRMHSPSWSPDGERVVFSGNSFAGNNDLYILDLDSEKLTQLTNDFYEDRDPAWSPDGKVIAFASDRSEFGQHGSHDIFYYHLETGDIEYATYDPADDYSPAWSPDGNALAFVSDRDDAFNIWLIQSRTPSTQIAAHAPGDSAAANHSLPAPDLSAQSQDYSLQGTSTPPANQSLIAGPALEGYANSYTNGARHSGTGATPSRLYPRAVNGAGDVRKLTNFFTGAYDPEWTDKGSLLFTAFEGFSFQIRELENVQGSFEKSRMTAVDTMQIRRSPWEIAKLEGESAPTQVNYNKKFSLDIAQSVVTQDPIFGTTGGAQLAMSDMLGNQQYNFLIFNNAQSKDEFWSSFNIAVSKADLSHRANYSYGLFHFAGRYYNYAEGYYYERRYGGFAALSYPISVFRRLEASLNIRQSDKDRDLGFNTLRGLLVSNFVSYVKDNSLWGPTGPLDGERFNLTVGNTIDVRASNINFYTIIADYRRYFRTGLRTAYAFRLTTQYNQGREGFRFFMGGSWDLRLYPRWQIWGQKTVLWSNEFRFPFIDQFAVAFPFGGLGFRAIRGAIFFDMGNAWDDRLSYLLGATGLGLRLNLGGFLVLRYDFGRRILWRDIDRGLALNKFKLYPDIRHQFFFGWDF